MADLDNSPAAIRNGMPRGQEPDGPGGAGASGASGKTALARGVLAVLGLPDDGFDDENHLVLTLDGATLHAQLIDQGDAPILVLGADLGEIAAASAQPVYAQLLAANLAWRSVGGGSLALDAQSGHGLLVLRFDGWPCALDTLGQRLYAFIEAAERWATVLRAADATPALPPSGGDDAAGMPSVEQSVRNARMATLFNPSNHA